MGIDGKQRGTPPLATPRGLAGEVPGRRGPPAAGARSATGRPARTVGDRAAGRRGQPRARRIRGHADRLDQRRADPARPVPGAGGAAGAGSMTAVSARPSVLSATELSQVDALWRAANYLAAGQIYLLDNPLLALISTRHTHDTHSTPPRVAPPNPPGPTAQAAAPERLPTLPRRGGPPGAVPLGDGGPPVPGGRGPGADQPQRRAPHPRLLR